MKPFIALAVLVLALSSCSPPLDRHELQVLLPPAPESWAALPSLEFELSWRDEGGRPSSARLPMGGILLIAVERGRPQAILATPYSSGRALRPAGALYPEAFALVPGASARGDELALDWRGGYAAALWRRLESGGVDPGSYDIYRLVDAALAKSGDPWRVETAEVARRLVEQSFRLSIYSEKPSFSILIPSSGWAPESPFAEGSVDLAQGGCLLRLPPGLWRFLGPSGELLVSVKEGGKSSFIEY